MAAIDVAQNFKLSKSLLQMMIGTADSAKCRIKTHDFQNSAQKVRYSPNVHIYKHSEVTCLEHRVHTRRTKDIFQVKL